jgi:membrane associated rhomboid family serine protease
MNMLDEIKMSFRKGNILFRLIYINIAVFVAAGLVFVMMRLFTRGLTLDELRIVYNEKVMNYLMVPSLPRVMHRPWTVITYMFAHTNFQISCSIC